MLLLKNAWIHIFSLKSLWPHKCPIPTAFFRFGVSVKLD